MLTTHSWSITWTGTTPTAATLLPGQNPGYIDVFLNTNNTSNANHTFSYATGMDLIDCGTLTNFTVIDRVPAADKPTNDAGLDNGIKVQGGSGGMTLRMELADVDTLIEMTDSNSSESTIRVTDTSSSIGRTRTGSGVSLLVIRTNDIEATEYRGDPGSGIEGVEVRIPKKTSGLDLLIDSGGATFAKLILGSNDSINTASVKTGAGNDLVIVQESIGDDGANVTVDFGAGTGMGNGLGLDNKLIVNGAGAATLGRVGAGSGPIVVDFVEVYQDGSFDVGDESTIGDLRVFGLGVATVSADGTEISSVNVYPAGDMAVEAETTIGVFALNGTATFIGSSDPSTIETLDLNFADSLATLNIGGDAGLDVDTLNVYSGETGGFITAVNTGVMTIEEANVSGLLTFELTTSGASMSDITVETFNASGGEVRVKDGGLLTVVEASTFYTLLVDDGDASVLFQKTGSHVNNLTITDGGLVTIQERDVAPTSSGARALIVNSLSFGPNNSITGTLDLMDNDLIIDHGGTSPIGTWTGTEYDGITGMIASGRNGGNWDGLGINTSIADSSGYFLIGVVEASDALGLSGSNTALFGGQTVDATSVLVKFTYGGDVDLDGDVDVDDYGQLDFNASTNGALFGYYNGDLDYNGIFDVDDFGIIDYVIEIQGPPL